MTPSDKDKAKQEVVVRGADSRMQGIIGNTRSLGKVFTKEKIANCQKMVDTARDSFFDSAKDDMITIEKLSENKIKGETFKKFYEELFQPLSNIKGQADIFHFPLIADICKYLMSYSQRSNSSKEITDKDLFIITQLVKALRHCFNEKITDKDGKLEKQLAELMKEAWNE